MTAEHAKGDVRAAVRDQYGSIARGTTVGCCAPGFVEPSWDVPLEVDSARESPGLGFRAIQRW